MQQSYYLLTGATGLLGGYLMRDCMNAGLRLAVVARPTRTESAQQRIDTIMARWEKQAGRAYPCPVVIDGDLHKPGLGFSRQDQEWVNQHCQGMIHNAASLTFVGEDRSKEPWLSNVSGTRHMLDVCREANIREMHHVSTAYVCGLRDGTCLETELNEGQLWGNSYERSKVESETMVREWGFDSLTVHRPGIIIGDSITGYTSTFHGLYAPLKIVHTVVNKVKLNHGMSTLEFAKTIQNGLNLQGDETKNFIPVDWVSAVMSHVISHPEHHGKTYHLTPDAPVQISDVTEVINDIVITHSFDEEKVASVNGSALPADYFGKFFREQMEVYRAYWRNDPVFDTSNTKFAAPHLPCPAMDRNLLMKLCRFAVDTNFGWPRPKAHEPSFDVAKHLQSRLTRSPGDGDESRWGLEVSGTGGGQWEIVVQNGQVAHAERRPPQEDAPVLYLNSNTFERLAGGSESVESALLNGQIFVETRNGAEAEATDVLRALLG